MNRHPQWIALAVALLATLLAGCTTMPSPSISRNVDNAAAPVAGQSSATDPGAAGQGVSGQAVDAGIAAQTEPGVPQAQIRRGSGQSINTAVANSPPPNLVGTTGEARFNFEGESLQAVAKAILGDMLGQNYVIAPGVQGTVTYVTSKPVSPAEALSLLEMVLGWNNASLIYSDGRYNIVPADGAMATGTVAPRTGPATNVRGYESRVVPLKYVSAGEMEKILKPYARPNAIVNVDNGRNVITVAGSRTELANYLRTIQIFDVDWMSSMSVGVFPLQGGKASQVVTDLEKVFGEQGKSPVAGMFRFMPIESANAILVISSQPRYLDQIQEWIDRIDSAGGGVQLYSYELKYIKAKELADRLAEVFGSSGGGGRSGTGGDSGASLMPGTTSTSLDGYGTGRPDSTVNDNMGSSTSGGTGLGEGMMSLEPRQEGNGAVTLEIAGERVGVAAVDETNTLLFRTSGRAWKSIREVVERLDVMPLQVHIEAQVAQVTLSGDLQYGVNWYFENPLGTTTLPANLGIRNLTNTGLNYTVFPGSAAAIISALDQVSDVKILQSPSVFVRNNAEATFNVGTSIPISSVSFNTSTGNEGTYSQVQYLDTGIILKVRPRITKDGMVFLDFVQEVSTPGAIPETCVENCNPPINTRRLKSEAAVKSGNTMLMAGLINDGETRGSSGLPGLSRIPVIGGLFGSQKATTTRDETIILITPTIVYNSEEAADLTDEYSRRFRAMQPLNTKPTK